jgi:hypothetical protein
MLIANATQLYTFGNWARKLKSTIPHSANKMDNEAVAQLTEQLDIPALHEYRLAVGRRTREIVKRIRLEELNQKVDPNRLQKVLDSGAVTSEAMEIINYWSMRTIAGLLLMPPTRHNFLHLNEAMRVKNKL